MKNDRMFFEKFENRVKDDEIISKHVEAGNFEAAEDYIKSEIFNKPEEYFDMDKLRKAAQIDRRLTLREIIEKIFGFINRFKSKDELLNDEFDKFTSIYKPEVENVLPIKNFLKAYITDSTVRDIVETKEY